MRPADFPSSLERHRSLGSLSWAPLSQNQAPPPPGTFPGRTLPTTAPHWQVTRNWAKLPPAGCAPRKQIRPNIWAVTADLCMIEVNGCAVSRIEGVSLNGAVSEVSGDARSGKPTRERPTLACCHLLPSKGTRCGVGEGVGTGSI